MSKLLLAHDLGTSGNKATIFSEEGRLIESASHEYPTEYAPGGFAEQDPAHWWEAVRITSRKLMEKRDPGDVAAVSFSGQMMGCLCVDKAGAPLRKHILYCDQRSTKEEAAFKERGGAEEIYRITGHRASASYGATKLMWVRDNQPGIYKNTHKMLNAKDWLTFRLTGRMIAEPTDASSTNLYDLVKGDWSDELVKAAGLERDMLPEIIPSIGIVGELAREAAEALGLKAGIPVVAGAGDGMCAGVGAGSVAPGLTYNYLGSSSWIATTSEKPLYDPMMRTFTWAHAVPGTFHPTGTMQTASASYAWLQREICREETRIAGEEGKSPFQVMDRTASGSPPGANGLVYLPYLLGERTPRWNPIARGGFVGLTMTHTRADMVRSVLEGVSMNLSIIVDIFRGQGLPVDKMTVIGGGAKGKLWRDIMADIYEVEINIPNYLEEATSIGAAIIAGVGAGIYKDFSVVNNFFRVVDTVRPRAENLETYRNHKKLFDKLYAALEPTFPDFPV
ncbi:MAG: xylulokinase [Planctomycetota bacterium]|jgi:xylulokinase|nr:xylulokinase [Planctomycetota bacterium]